MATDQAVEHSADAEIAVESADGGRRITIEPTFQRGFVPNVVDGFRFTLVATGANLMPTKVFRYRLVPTKVRATADQPPETIELKGAFDGVCSPADLEDFPEDWPGPNARPPWYRLDRVDLIVRSRSIAAEAYEAILFELRRLVDTLDTMDGQEAATPVVVGAPEPEG